jgi:hypothetical protein
MLRQWIARRRLAKLLRPNPEYRNRRLAQFNPERRERYWKNVNAASTH